MHGVDPVELGRAFMAELRDPAGLDSGESRPTTDQLRWDGEELDDETVWVAIMTAVELAGDASERWRLGDGVIDEQIATRPVLRQRWRRAYASSPAVRAVFSAMWQELDLMPDGRGWWEEPPS